MPKPDQHSAFGCYAATDPISVSQCNFIGEGPILSRSDVKFDAVSDDELLWTHQAPPMPKRRPGELLFALTRGDHRIACELRYHGEYGVEAQFSRDGELIIGRRFDTRAQAVQCAELEGGDLRRQGWIANLITP